MEMDGWMDGWMVSQLISSDNSLNVSCK